MDLIAGCVGGASGVLVGHPFDTVKVRLQVQNVDKPLYRGTFHCFQSIVRKESALGLYKGIGPPMMGLTFINAIVFGVQSKAMRLLGRDTPANQFATGAAAGALQCVVCCPMELAKTRLQMQTQSRSSTTTTRLYRNSLDCLSHIYRREGVRGLNRGMVATLVRETPSFGVYFMTYDVLKRSLGGCGPGDAAVVPKLLLAGGTSGVASWLVTYPADVIKSRLQADGVGGVSRYGGIADCVRQSVRREGYVVFTRGLTSTLLRAFPVNAATLATYTLFLSFPNANTTPGIMGACSLWKGTAPTTGGRYTDVQHCKNAKGRAPAESLKQPSFLSAYSEAASSTDNRYKSMELKRSSLSVASERELRASLLACLYLSYSYVGNKISYPPRPFLQAEAGLQEAFWDRCLEIVNRMSDPHFFSQVFSDLKNQLKGGG